MAPRSSESESTLILSSGKETPQATSTAASLIPWLALFHTPEIGEMRYHQILTHFDTPENFLSCTDEQLKHTKLPSKALNALAAYRKTPDSSKIGIEIAKDQQWLQAPENHILTLADSDYPVLLRNIENPPPILYVSGQRACLSTPQIAMVGSRNPSVDGKENAYRFASSLAKTGVCITSGLAIGIDGVTHKAALEAGGITIAVIGTGLDRVYPASHQNLAKHIKQQGALVSCFPLGTGPLRGNFPKRNRIISGLSLGTIVVEASIRSGSLITARTGLEQGREIYAIPGSIHNPMAKGCHHLIKQGAKLVETADDVFEEIGSLFAYHEMSRAQIAAPQASSKTTNKKQPLDDTKTELTAPEAEPVLNLDQQTPITAEEQMVIDAIGFDAVSIDKLVNRTQLKPEELTSILLMLELQGHVLSVAGGYQLNVS